MARRYHSSSAVRSAEQRRPRAEQHAGHGLGRLVDDGDAGDTYTHEPVEEDIVVGARREDAQVVSGAVDRRLRLKLSLDVPIRLDERRRRRLDERTRLPVEIEVGRWPGVPQLEWHVALDNTAEDHRLRLAFPLQGQVSDWRTDAAFSTTTRPVLDAPPPPVEGFGKERGVGTAPMQTWCAAGSEEDALGVLAGGLAEAETRRTDGGAELLVTLLRCVGWLSRDDLSARTQAAGPSVPVPEARCPGSHRFRLALCLDDDEGVLAAGGQVWRAPLRALQLAGPPERGSHSHLRVSPPALLSALKSAEDGDGAVLRVRNPTARAVTATVQLSARTAHLVHSDLDDRHGAELSTQGQRFELPLGPYALATVRIGALNGERLRPR